MLPQVHLNERIDQKIQDAPNVSASNTAIFRLPIGRRFHELQLVLAGTAIALAHISRIRVIANEVVIHEYTAAERDAMNQFDGRAAWHITNNPVLVIPFERYGLENSPAEQLTALDTGEISPNTPVAERGSKIRSVTVELELTSSFPANGSIRMFATQSMSLGKGSGTVLHVMRDARTIPGAGNFELFDLPYNSVRAQALNRVFIGVSGGQSITNLKVDRDNFTIFERTNALNASIQADGVRTPQSGYFVVDRSEKGQVGNRMILQGVQDFRYKADVSGACTLTFLSEYMGGLGD